MIMVCIREREELVSCFVGRLYVGPLWHGLRSMCRAEIAITYPYEHT